MNRMLRIAPLLVVVLALSACGFHLRRNAALPPSMGHVHVVINGNENLKRQLARALENTNVSVEDHGGPGIAELRIPDAGFSTDSLTQGGYTRITELAVHYVVKFNVIDGDGKTLLPEQQVDLQREYSYDSTDVGSAAQADEIRRGLVTDMVQAIMFRLEAAGRHAQTASAATGTP